MGKIIIIDDSETVRYQLRGLLEAKSHVVVEGKDGTDGVRKISENLDADLIISDFKMPGSNGLEMLTRIQNTNHGTKIPIFMFTAETDEDLKEEGRKIGVTAWIMKPCNFEKLLAAVDKVLEKSGNSQNLK